MLTLHSRQQGVKYTRLPVRAFTELAGGLGKSDDGTDDAATANMAPPPEWPTSAPLIMSQVGVCTVGEACCSETGQRFIICDLNARIVEDGQCSFRSPWSGAWQTSTQVDRDDVAGLIFAARSRDHHSSRLSVLGKVAASGRAPSVAVDPAGDGWMTVDERALELRLNRSLNDYVQAHFCDDARPLATVILAQAPASASKAFVVHAITKAERPRCLWLGQHTVTVTSLRDAVKCELSSTVFVQGGIEGHTGTGSAVVAYAASVNVADVDYHAILGRLIQGVEAHAHSESEEQLRRGLRAVHGSCRTETSTVSHDFVRKAFALHHGKGATPGSWSEPRQGEVTVSAAPGFGSSAPSLAASPVRQGKTRV